MAGRGQVLMLLHPECDNVLLAVMPAHTARSHLRDYWTPERRRSEHRRTTQKSTERGVLCNITPSLSPLVGEGRRTYNHQKAAGGWTCEAYSEFPPQRAHGTLNRGNFVTGAQEGHQLRRGASLAFRRKDPAYPTHGLVYCLSPQSEAFARCLRKYPECEFPARPALGAHSRELIARLTARDTCVCSRKTFGRKSIHSLPDKKCPRATIPACERSRAPAGSRQVCIATDRESKSASSARDKDGKMGDDGPAGPRDLRRRARGRWSSLVSGAASVKAPGGGVSAQYEYLPYVAPVVAPLQTSARVHTPPPARTRDPARTGASNRAATPTKARTSSRTASPTKAPVSGRTASPTKAPVSSRGRAASPTRDPASNRADSPTKSPASSRANSPKAPASRRADSPTKAPASRRADSPTKAPASRRAATSTKTPASNRAATPTRAPASSRAVASTKAPTSPVIRGSTPDRAPAPAAAPAAGAAPAAASAHSPAPHASLPQPDTAVNNMYQVNPTVYQMCPTLQKRLMRHKESCALRETDSDVSVDSEQEGFAPLFCRLLQYLTCESDQPSPRQKSPTPSQDKRYCPCSKSPKCTCSPRPHYPRCVWYPNRPPPICPCKKKDDIYYSNKVYDAISIWLSNIPVPTNDCPENNNLRLELAEQLAAEILRLPADDNHETNVKAAIEKYIDKIPMWTPDSKQDKENLKKHLLESLLGEITEIPRHPNLLKEKVKSFVDSLSVGDDVDKKALVDDIVKTLTFLGTHAPTQDSKFIDLLISEIVKKLDKIPLEYDGDRNVILNSLAKKLAHDVENLLKHIDLIADEEKEHKRDAENKMKKDVADWFSSFREQCGKMHSDADIKKIEQDLTTKFKKLMSEGATESKRNLMENEIDKVLQNLDIDTELRPKLISSLMDKLTDNIYAEEKRMRDEALEKKTFDEIKKWVNLIPGVKDLDVTNQYNLIKELAGKIKTKEQEGVTDYRNDIVESLQKAGFNAPPATIQQELDNLMKTMHSLPEQVQRDDLNKEIRKKLVDTINNNPDIPKDSNLVKELNNVLSQIMKTSPIATKKDIENTKEKLLEHMNERLLAISMNEIIKASFRDELANILDKDFDKLKETKTKTKEAGKQLLLKEVNYAINEEPITADLKDYLKFAIKDLVEEKFATPFSHHILKTINEEMEDLINENDIEDKKRVTGKLKQIVAKLDDLPKESLTEYEKNNLIKAIDSEINKRNIIDEIKNELKQNIRNIIKINFQQPYTSRVKLNILDGVNEAIENSVLPVSKKDSLMNTITGVATDILNRIPKQTMADYVKEAIADEIYENREDFMLSSEDLKKFMRDLRTAISDALDRPYKEQDKLKLQTKIQDITDQTNIPLDKKAKVATKVLDIAGHHLDNLPYQTNQSYAKEELTRYINKAVGDLDLPSEQKEKLIEVLDETIEESIGDDLKQNRQLLEEATEKVIRESEIPPEKQDILLSNLKAHGAQILEESFYPEDVLDYLTEADKRINKSGLSEEEKSDLKTKLRNKVDDIAEDPDFMNKTDDIANELGLNQLPHGPQDSDIKCKIEKITTAVKGTSMSSSKKTILLNKINETADDIHDDKDFNKLVKELEKFIEDIPLPSSEKKALEMKLEVIADPHSKEVQKKIKTVMMKDIEAAVEQIPIPQEKKEDVMKELHEVLASESKTTTTVAKERIKEGAQRVIDKNVFSKDKNIELKKKLAGIVDNVPTHESNPKDEVIDVAFKTLDESGFRPHIIEQLKTQIKEIISRLFARPYEVNARSKAMKDLKSVIRNSRLTEYQKRTLEPKLIGQIKRKLDKLPGGIYLGGGVGDVMLKNLNKAVDEAAIPKEAKMEITKNIKQFASEADLMSNEGKEMLRQKLKKNMDESKLPTEQKANLTAKMQNEITQYEVPTESRVDLMNAIMKDVHKNINETPALAPPIQKSLKKDITETVIEKVKKKLPPQEIKDTVKADISGILNKTAIPKAQKEELKTTLKKSVSINIEKDRVAKEEAIQREKDKANERGSKGDEADEFKRFMEDIATAISDALDGPYTEEEKLKLQRNIQNITEQTNIPLDQKAKVATKVLDIASKHLDDYQSNAKNELTRYVKKAVSDLEIPRVEKRELIENLKGTIEENIGDDLKANKEVLEEAAKRIIRESDLSSTKQETLLGNLKSQGAKILEETFLPEDVLDYLTETEKNINKSGLSEKEKVDLKSKLRYKVDDIAEEPDFLNKTDDLTEELGLHQLPLGPQDSQITRKIEKIKNVVEETSMPSNKKTALLKTITDKGGDIRDNKAFNEFVKELEKFIEDIPLPSKEKKALEFKLAVIADPKSKEVQKKIKTEMIKDIEAAVEQIPIPKEKKEDVKKELQEVLESESKTTTSIAKERIKEGAQKVIDKNVLSREKNLALTTKFADIVDNVPTHDLDAKEELIDTAFETLDEGGFRPHVLEYLKSQIKDVIVRLFARPYEVDARSKAMKDLKSVIRNSRLTEYQKRILEPKLIQQIKRKLDKLPGGIYLGGGVGDAMLRNVNKAVDEATIPEEAKMEITRDIKKFASEADLSTNEGKEMFRQKIIKELDESTLPPEEKANLTARIQDELTQYEVPTESRVDLMNAIMKDIHKSINETPELAPLLQKSLKKDITETVIEKVNKKLPPQQIKDTVKADISSILNKTEIPKTEKEELKTILKKAVSVNIEKDRVAKEDAMQRASRRKDKRVEIMDGKTGGGRSDYDESQGGPRKDAITVIGEWLDGLPIQMTDEMRDTLLNEIAEDMNERREYLKMFPSAKKSDQDELDHLQYQVTRRLKKVLDEKDMEQVMQASDALTRQLKEQAMSAGLESQGGKGGMAFPQEYSPTANLTFDKMKEELADAFFDLNFTGGTEEERAIAKKKITEQVFKFSDDYLEAHPGESLDYETLKLKLYEELQKAVLLPDGTISVVEQTAQDVIEDLMKSMPPLDHLTCIERKNLEKEANLLESKLREIDRNEAGLTKDEIRKQKAIATKEFQQKVLSIIDECQKKPRLGTICPDLKRLPVCPPAGPCPGLVRHPPCSLSAADRKHLDSIRQRTCMEPECLSSLLRTCKPKVCPKAQLVSSACQTEEAVCPGILRSPECPFSRRAPPAPCSRPARLISTKSNTEQVMTNSGVQCDSERGVYPEVNVKEHGWESLEPEESTSRLRQRDASTEREEAPPCRVPRDCIDLDRICPSARRLRYSTMSPDCTVPIPKCEPQLPCPPVPCAKPCRPPPCRSITFNPPAHSTPRHSISSYPEDRNYGRPKRGEGQRSEFRSTIPSRHFGNERLLKLNEKLRRSERISWCPGLPDEGTCEPPRCRWQEEAARPCYSRRRVELPDCCNDQFLMNTGRRRCPSHGKRQSCSSVSFTDDQEHCYMCNADIHCPFPSEGFFK